MNSRLLYLPPPVYALLVLGVCYGLTSVLPIAVDVSFPALGAVMVTLALIVLFWAWWSFRRCRTTPLPMGTPSMLVTIGPYRRTRNPMYLGIVAVLAAVPWFAGSLWYLLAAPMFWYIVNTLFIPYEEARLNTLFHAEFRDFAAKVPRWL